MTPSALRTLVIACAVLGPVELSAQSWLQYRGRVDGRYSFTCTVPEGARSIAPQAGPFAFFFADGEVTSQGGFARGTVSADGSARGGSKAEFIWRGDFRLGNDGSVQGRGSISPAPGEQFGCTGNWTADKPAGPPLPNQPPGPTSESTVCAEYRRRIQRVEANRSAYNSEFNRDRGENQAWRFLEIARAAARETSKEITYLKGRNVEASNPRMLYLQDIRRDAYEEITKYDAIVKTNEKFDREIMQHESEARAAGCTNGSLAVTPKSGVAKGIDQLLGLDSPKDPSANPTATSIGVAGVQGSVEVETLGSRGSARDGSPIPLSEPVTLRTGPNSSVTIQVGSVRKTLQPNTVIRIMPRSNGQPDFIEQGAATVDLRKPGAYPIQTPTATVKAGGTVFTVSYDATTGVTGVMLEEGRVTVTPKNPGVRAVTLAPGEYVEVGRNTMTAVLPAPGAPQTAGITQSIDLTGLWRDDTGGGAIYRLRQVGNWLYWLVDGTPKGSYVNLSYGQISGSTITGTWVDMPGSPTLSGGNLVLRIESNDRLVKVGASGYGAQAWVRVTSGGNR